ncbi:MAG: cupin domain-containing protein [Cyanophyceae cyanobacterium]
MLTPAAQALIDQLQLQSHPEGGYFRETWRASLVLPPQILPDHGGPRAAGTLIYYLLPTGSRSRAHRVRSDELWLFHAGDPLLLTVRATPDGAPEQVYGLGQKGCYQAVVPANRWQEAEPQVGKAGYALVSCVVVPGFDFADFEMVPSPR